MVQNSTVLKIESLSVFYGKIHAVRDISLEVNNGEIVSLIGANGTGKSTVMKAVIGVQRPSSGTVQFMGRDITRMSTDSIVASGIAYVPEGGGAFPFMTVLENLQLGAIYLKGNFNNKLTEAFERFPILQKRQHQQAGTLSGGERQMLAISRALIADPKLLMLDEPSLGLAPLVINDVFKTIVELKKSGYTILLSEQNAKMALRCCDRAYVFETGSIALHGTGQELLNNKAVQRTYVGGS